MSKKDKGAANDKNETQVIEWILGGLSAVLVLGLAGFLVYEGFTKRGGEPLLSLHVLRVVQHEEANNVVVAVRNDGHATAANVEIAGILAGDSVVRRATLDYAPAESEREVTLTFPTPFAVEALDLFVLGFVDP